MLISVQPWIENLFVIQLDIAFVPSLRLQLYCIALINTRHRDATNNRLSGNQAPATNQQVFSELCCLEINKLLQYKTLGVNLSS